MKTTRLSQKSSLVFDLMLLLSVSFPQLDFKQSALSTVSATKGKKNGANWVLLFLAALKFIINSLITLTLNN